MLIQFTKTYLQSVGCNAIAPGAHSPRDGAMLLHPTTRASSRGGLKLIHMGCNAIAPYEPDGFDGA